MANPLLMMAQAVLQKGMNQMPNGNAPWAAAAINAIMTGDDKAGQQIANNIVQSMGMTREQAMSDVRNHLKLPF